MASTDPAKRIPNRVLHSLASAVIRYAKQAVNMKKKSKSPSGKPKKFLSSVSNKVNKLCQRKKNVEEDGVWRKEILLGDKCQPLDFSGVIYYDKDGNLLTEFPKRSPRASPLPRYA